MIVQPTSVVKKKSPGSRSFRGKFFSVQMEKFSAFLPLLTSSSSVTESTYLLMVSYRPRQKSSVMHSSARGQSIGSCSRQATGASEPSVAHRVLRGVTRQLIAALCAARRGYETCTRQLHHDLLKVLRGNLLPFGNVAQRDVPPCVVLRKVDHQAQRVSAFG